MVNAHPVKAEDALQSCLLDFCSSDNPRFIDLVRSEGCSTVQNFMLKYWEGLEEYEKCSIIIKKMKKS